MNARTDDALRALVAGAKPRRVEIGEVAAQRPGVEVRRLPAAAPLAPVGELAGVEGIGPAGVLAHTGERGDEAVDVVAHRRRP